MGMPACLVLAWCACAAKPAHRARPGPAIDAQSRQVVMSVTVEGHPQRASGTATVGRDWGLETFATVVDAHGKNQPVKNPRFPDQAQRQKLKLLQQALSRKANKRSRNRRQAVSALAREPVRIASRRKDFLHQESGKWVTRCGLLATEPLNVKGMTAHGGAYKTCHACFDL